MFRTLLSALSAFALLLGMAATASAEKRIALIVGNSAYAHAPRLANPANDAADVDAALKELGFETVVGLDLDRDGMEEKLIEFSRSARDADVALFYYSGHAMQFNGENYLMPVDAILRDEADLRRLTLMRQVKDDLASAKNLKILVLDACRDNPLAEELKRSIGRTRGAGVSRGLARVDSIDGMIVAFSTAADATADDGSGRNSPYTAAFLKHIDQAAEVRKVFQDIAAEAYRASGRKQLPELFVSLYDDYFLRDRPAVAAAAAGPGSSQELDLLKQEFAEFKRSKEPNPDEKAWASLSGTSSSAMLEEFVRQFPLSVYAVYARARLSELQHEAARKEEEERQSAEKVALVTPPSAPVPVAPAPAIVSPSFPCAKASLAVEHAICGSHVLAGLDRELDSLFAWKNASRTARSVQTGWLNRRNACGSNEACIEQRYRERIAELQGGGGSPAAANPSFPCSKARHSAEIAICNSAVLAGLDVELNRVYLRFKGRKAYEARQRAWVDRRNACGSNEACIEQRYREQIANLQSGN